MAELPRFSELVDPPLAPPPPMAELERRARTLRRRRWAARGVGGGAAAIAAVVAVVAVLPGPQGHDVRTVAPATSENQASTPSVVPSIIATGAPLVLTTFERDGSQWRLLAKFVDDGICMELSHDGAPTQTLNCWTPFFERPKLVVKEVGSFAYLAGILPPEVTAVALGDGTPVEILGRGAGFPVNFVGHVLPEVPNGLQLSISPSHWVPLIQGVEHARVSGIGGSELALPSPTTTTTQPTTVTTAPPRQEIPPVTPDSTTTVPRTTVPPPTTTVPPPTGGQPQRVTIVPNAANVRRHGFDSASAVGTSSVAVRWWGGVEPCDVLARVDVVEAADKVTITLWSGNGPDGDGPCIAIAVQKEYVVQLSAPLAGRTIVDGAD